jgi:hypothetical protein
MQIPAFFLGFITLFIAINSADVNATTNYVIEENTDEKHQVESKEVKKANHPLGQLKQLTSLPLAKGPFKQRKYFTILKEPIVSSGEVYFDQQLGLIWQTTHPISSVLRLKKSGLYMQDAVSPEREVKGAGAITQVLMNALSGNVNALENEFSVQSSNQNGCIRLLPKGNVLANIMQSIDLCMIENKLNRIVLLEHSGNRTEIDINLSALTELPEAISAQLQ